METFVFKNWDFTTHSDYDAESAESNGEKNSGFLYPNLIYSQVTNERVYLPNYYNVELFALTRARS